MNAKPGLLAVEANMEPTLKLFALVSDQGTACRETALCEKHLTAENKAMVLGQLYGLCDILDKETWHDCSGNDALYCNDCGLGIYGEPEPEERQNTADKSAEAFEEFYVAYTHGDTLALDYSSTAAQIKQFAEVAYRLGLQHAASPGRDHESAMQSLDAVRAAVKEHLSADTAPPHA